MLMLLGVLGVGAAEPPPTTTTVPESPAAGLALESVAPLSRNVAAAASPVAPHTPIPGPPEALAALVAGMAVLAARARRIATAEQTIRSALQDSLFSDVGHSDLMTIARTVGSLDAGEADAAVSALSDNELGVWMRELDGWQGGFDRVEQSRLFDTLAARLRPRQLRRLIAQGKATALMAAVSSSAPPNVAAELALLLWGDRDPTQPGWDHIIGLLADAPVDVAEATVAAASPPGLATDLLGKHSVAGDDAPRVQLDAMAGFLDIAGEFGDPHLKAELFLAIGEQLRDHRRQHAVGETSYEDVLGRLTALVRSDTAGVITRLNHAADPHGNLMSEWIEDMIEADRFDELDVLFADLIGGADRIEFFSDPGTDRARPYPNAANLGYYVGAYSLAIDNIAEDAADQIHLVSQLFSLVTGLVPGPAGSGVRLPFGPLVDVHAESVIDDLRDQSATLQQTLWGLAKPRTSDGLAWNGAGVTQFQDSWEEVVVVR